MLSVVGVLAVSKVGGAYLLLDPEYPAERLFNDVSVRVLLTNESLGPRHEARCP